MSAYSKRRARAVLWLVNRFKCGPNNSGCIHHGYNYVNVKWSDSRCTYLRDLEQLIVEALQVVRVRLQSSRQGGGGGSHGGLHTRHFSRLLQAPEKLRPARPASTRTTHAHYTRWQPRHTLCQSRARPVHVNPFVTWPKSLHIIYFPLSSDIDVLVL